MNTGAERRVRYSVVGVNPVTGRKLKHELHAVSSEEALAAARGMGLCQIKVQRVRGVNFARRQPKPSTADRRLAMQALARAFSLNMDAAKAVSHSADGLRPSSAMSKLLGDLSVRLQGGESLSSAIRHYEKPLGESTVAAIEAGAATGVFGDSLAALADVEESKNDVRGKIRAAMYEPASVLLLVAIAFIVATAYVFPMYAGQLESVGGEMPGLSQALIDIADFVLTWWWALIVGTVGGWLLWRQMLRRVPALGRAVGRITLAVPIAKGLARRKADAAYCSLVGILLGAGVDNVQVTDIAAKAVDNRYLRYQCLRVITLVKSGYTLEDAYRQLSPPLPRVYAALAGQSHRARNNETAAQPWVTYADSAMKEAKQTADKLSAAIQPLLFVVIGAMIVVLGYGMSAPSTQMITEIQKLG